MTKKSFDHRQLLVAPNRNFILDEVCTHLDAPGMIKIILSVAVAFITKLEVCTFKHACMSPKTRFDFDQQIWPLDMIHDLCRLRVPRVHIGWGA